VRFDALAALWGAATFAFAALLLKPIAQSGLGLPMSGLAFVFGGALLTGLCEELTRAGAMRWRHRALPRTARWALAFAVGYALAEVVLVGIAWPLQLHHLAGKPELMQALPEAHRVIVERQLAALGPWTPLWLVLERGSAVVAQLGLAWIVWRAVATRRGVGVCKGVGLAVGLHTLIDVPAAGFQAGWWPLWAVEVLYLLAALLAAPAVLRAWRAGLSAAPARAATSG
jgi:uncharacterized membrane protein YhfC